MDDLIIKGSNDIYYIPGIHFSAQTGILEITGESYPEDTQTFYQPILKWLDDFFLYVNRPVTLNIKLTYFNTSSSKSILDLLLKLKEQKEKGTDINVNWFFSGDDPDVEEDVEDFKLDSGLDINLIVDNNL
jgi:hypothetical protein